MSHIFSVVPCEGELTISTVDYSPESGRIKAALLWWHVMTYAWLTDIPKLLVGIMFMRRKSFGLHICSFPGFFVVSFMRGKIKTRVSSKCLWIHLLATSIPMHWLLVQSYRMVLLFIFCALACPLSPMWRKKVQIFACKSWYSRRLSCCNNLWNLEVHQLAAYSE